MDCEHSNLTIALARWGLFPASPIDPSIAFEIIKCRKLLLLAQISYEFRIHNLKYV